MWAMNIDTKWHSLTNPFNNDTAESITGHVSGRSTDIHEIIVSGQNAIILAGTPNIGKSTLIRYLQRSSQLSQEWTWRKELDKLHDLKRLNTIHFIQIDLTPLEGLRQKEELLSAFIKECTCSLYKMYYRAPLPSSTDTTVKGLYELLRQINCETTQGRYFVMLDAIERLGRSSTLIDLKTGAQTPQERGIALLEQCGVIRTMVNLFDEFRIFGVIISIESLPRPKMVDQFIHVSADLARFTTMLLQIFTWGDTCKFLAQKPEDMGEDWAATFRNLGGTFIFSEGEQRWLLEQGGSHPYLLQQFCFYTFQLKALTDTWTDIQEIHKTQLTTWINERVSTFLSTTWKRLQVALRLSSRPKEIQAQFYEFIALIAPLLAESEIPSEFWYSLHPELRYILSSEGILRYDPFKPIHAPGATLRNYLVQKAQETHRYIVSQHIPLTPPTPDRGYWLRISKPERDPELLSLSELEYQLLKTLLSHADRCTEKELMLGAWNQIIERATFTQRMHKLRKKLQKQFDGEDIIVNTYGGIYSLLHPEWIQLE